MSRAASQRSQTMRSQEHLRSAEEKKADKVNELEQLEDKLAENISRSLRIRNPLQSRLMRLRFRLTKRMLMSKMWGFSGFPLDDLGFDLKNIRVIRTARQVLRTVRRRFCIQAKHILVAHSGDSKAIS